MNNMLLHQPPYDDTEDRRRLIKRLEDKIADREHMLLQLVTLIYQMREGLDDHWITLPENAKVVQDAKFIVDGISENTKKEIEEARLKARPLEWHIGAHGFNRKSTYWITDPKHHYTRWHVSYNLAGTMGSVAGQILTEEGWYWYVVDYAGHSNGMVGPFSSAEAAKADCEVAHK